MNLWRRQSGSYDHTFKNTRIQGCRDHVVGVSDWYVVPHGGGESDCHRPVPACAGRHRTSSIRALTHESAGWCRLDDRRKRRAGHRRWVLTLRDSRGGTVDAVATFR